jgi:hypothetical protein
MCGIVGFMTTKRALEEFDRKKFITSALAVDSIRGQDSTGVFMARHDKLTNETPATLRGTCDGYAFIQDETYRKLMTRLDSYWAVVGHNRAATKGSVSLKNTHPFHRGPIMLVHNGTVWNADKVADAAGADAEVDSDKICAALAENHVEDVAKVINGSFALVWHDTRDGKVRFLRNSERPIHLAATEDGSTVLFASEAEMLWFLAKRSGLKIRQPFMPNPGTLMAFSRDNLMKPEISQVPLMTYPTTAAVTYGGTFSGPFVAGRSTTTTTTSQLRRPSSALMAEFAKYRLIPDSNYTFIGHSYAQVPGSYNVCRLSGWIPAINHMAVIWDMPVAVGSHCIANKSPLRVEVVGIRYVTHEGKTVPCFVCAYIGRGEGNDTLRGGVAIGDTIIGPSGLHVSTDWWCDAVATGCSKCGALILPEDADVITWEQKNEAPGWAPICSSCSIPTPGV